MEVKGNIRADEELSVTVPASIAITAENDAGYTNTATVEMDFHTFYRAGLNLDTYTAVNGSVVFNETKADTYKGSVNFKVALENTIKKISFKYKFDGVVKDRTVVEGTTVGEAFGCSIMAPQIGGKCQFKGGTVGAIDAIVYDNNGNTVYPEPTDIIEEGILYEREYMGNASK